MTRAITIVRLAIRNLRRTDAESIQADPMYQYAAASLPAQAGVWFYVNQQINAEAAWQQTKESARAKAEKPEGTGNTGTDTSRFTVVGLNPANPMGSLAVPVQVPRNVTT